MNKELLRKVTEMMKPHPVYAVGGCVRDYLMGCEPKDYDFCTPAEPDEIERLVSIGAHVSSVFSLYPPITLEQDIKKKATMMNQFSDHMRALMEPKNFQLMSPQLTWKVYKRTIGLKLDLSMLI